MRQAQPGDHFSRTSIACPQSDGSPTIGFTPHKLPGLSDTREASQMQQQSMQTWATRPSPMLPATARELSSPLD
jgi:hypothetical protein